MSSASQASALFCVRRGRDYYSDASGRFDLMYSARARRWVCVDWEAGEVARNPDRAALELWAARQRKGRA